MAPPPRVVIVGAGVTGSMLAALLKEMGLSVKIIEKSRGAGGRMTTHSFRGGSGGRSEPVVGRADMGAQYLTTRSCQDHEVLGPMYTSLQSAGVLSPFTGQVAGPNPYGSGNAPRHFVAPAGLKSVAEHFLTRAEAEVEWDTALSKLDFSPNGSATLQLSRGASAQRPPTAPMIPDSCEDGGSCGSLSADIVVLTQPVPQLVGKSRYPVEGNFLDRLEDDTTLSKLRQVEFSSRFATAYFFDSKTFSWPYVWTAHYFEQGDVRYVAHDSGKRGAASEESMVSVLVHSGVPLGMELKDQEAPFEGAAARMLADLEKKLPDIPWSQASGVKTHKWLYSQVYKGIGAKRPDPAWEWTSGDHGFPGCVELFRTPQALGLIAGDSLAPAGNFEGCIYSAHCAAEVIKKFASDWDGQGLVKSKH